LRLAARQILRQLVCKPAKTEGGQKRFAAVGYGKLSGEDRRQIEILCHRQGRKKAGRLEHDANPAWTKLFDSA
jgi:hypothetical protein